MKIYVASDFHIGSEFTNYKKIREFLNLVKQDGDKLILVGDIFDLWKCTPEIIKDCEPYKSTYELLLDVAKIVPTHIVKGNHDYLLNKKLNLPNIEITNDFVKDNIYYIHGWQFDIKQKFGSFAYGWLINYFPFLYQLLFKKPSEIIDIEEKNTSDMGIYKEIKKFINKNDYKVIIIGHTHNPIIINKEIYDCGDFIDSCSYIIIDGDSNPVLKWL